MMSPSHAPSEFRDPQMSPRFHPSRPPTRFNDDPTQAFHSPVPFPTGVPRPRSTSIPEHIQEDTAQVDMVQGLLLRIALVHPEGAHLADTAESEPIKDCVIQ